MGQGLTTSIGSELVPIIGRVKSGDVEGILMSKGMERGDRWIKCRLPELSDGNGSHEGLDVIKEDKRAK